MSGFTKAETLIVTSIIISLGLLANYHFNLAKSKARDFERKEQLKQVAAVLEDYLIDNQAYPPSTGKYQFTGCGDIQCPTKTGGIPCRWHQNAVPHSLACGKYIYMDQIPRAPENPQIPGKASHRYLRPEPRKMILETCLELKSDIEAQPTDTSQTGYNRQNCRSGVIFQIIRN